MAAVVTVVDALLAFPIAYYMARVASPRRRALLFMSVLLPLWASYLVKVYAWRVILSPGGPLDWAFGYLGIDTGSVFGLSDLSITIVFTYLWLPYMILPIYAGLERIPSSFLEASADLGARGGMTFRRVVLPLAMPALVAGSIFTFSLTLGDYITPQLVGEQPVHRQRRLRQPGRRRQHPVRGGVRARARRDHGRLPARRPPARRVRRPLRPVPRGPER